VSGNVTDDAIVVDDLNAKVVEIIFEDCSCFSLVTGSDTRYLDPTSEQNHI